MRDLYEVTEGTGWLRLRRKPFPLLPGAEGDAAPLPRGHQFSHLGGLAVCLAGADPIDLGDDMHVWSDLPRAAATVQLLRDEGRWDEADRRREFFTSPNLSLVCGRGWTAATHVVTTGRIIRPKGQQRRRAQLTRMASIQRLIRVAEATDRPMRSVVALRRWARSERADAYAEEISSA